MSVRHQQKFFDYDGFVGKFKTYKTTDDCYTPANIYEAVKAWAVKEYNLEGREIVRPFWPGAEFEAANYPEGCVVIDNPPFSIIAKIVRWYVARKIDFFLFAPYLTNLGIQQCNHIIAPHSVTYENGAKVDTCFVTSLGDEFIRSVPELMDAIAKQDDINTKKAATLDKYEYPDCIVTSARIGYLCKHRQAFALKRSDGIFIRQIDANDKGIYGGGYLITQHAAAQHAAAQHAADQHAAAQRSAAIRWELSAREIELQKMIGKVRK